MSLFLILFFILFSLSLLLLLLFFFFFFFLFSPSLTQVAWCEVSVINLPLMDNKEGWRENGSIGGWVTRWLRATVLMLMMVIMVTQMDVDESQVIKWWWNQLTILVPFFYIDTYTPDLVKLDPNYTPSNLIRTFCVSRSRDTYTQAHMKEISVLSHFMFKG